MPPEPDEVVVGWLGKATSDRRAIEILLRDGDPPWDIVAFHAQQVAEKSLKALLAHRGIPFPRTHDLSVLVGRLGPESGFEPDDPAIVELTCLAVAPRYPEEPEAVERETAQRAVDTARIISGTVRRMIGVEDPG
jgi:HEPN domain-containing protein